MTNPRPAQITASHLRRRAIVYIRQSTLRQVEENIGSTTHQRNQKAFALGWGWAEADIEVIDQDLGLSGTSGGHRQGWQQLLKSVSDHEVGIIFVSDISRLSRSRRDFNILVELCREFEVLLAVDGAIVQFDNPHDTFMANIRADVAEYDNAIRRNTFMQAKAAKAKAGYAVTNPPAGYVVAEKGKWMKDPDAAVRQAIETVFQQYAALGSTRKVLRFFVAHHLQLPVRRSLAEVRWNRPSASRIQSMLRQPAYAGYYVFGRRPLTRKAGKATRPRLPWTDGVTITDHHEPYLAPAEWLRLQDRLANRQFMNGQPAGDGPALCQGLVRCGRCGHKMRTQYYGHPHPRRRRVTYTCTSESLQHGTAPCWNIPGTVLDTVVAAEMLRGLTPPGLEAVRTAAADVNAGYEAARQQRALELARVRHDADIMQRHYYQADPENRLVAAGLERNLERALEAVRAVERRHAQTPLAPPLPVTPDALEAIQRLATEVPALWAAPSTTAQDRKGLVRLLVREIRVVAIAEPFIDVEIAWVGGAVTSHRLARPFAGAVLARRLEAQGLTMPQIVVELDRLGIKTVGTGRPYTPLRVRQLLQLTARRAGRDRPVWSVYRESLRPLLLDLVAARFSNAAMAAELTRRGLPGYIYKRPWTPHQVRMLREDLGVPSVQGRSLRAYTQPRLDARDDLRGALGALTAQGWTDTAIAAEFARRGLPGSTGRVAWNPPTVRYLRLVLRVRAGRPRRSALRKAA